MMLKLITTIRRCLRQLTTHCGCHMTLDLSPAWIHNGHMTRRAAGLVILLVVCIVLIHHGWKLWLWTRNLEAPLEKLIVLGNVR